MITTLKIVGMHCASCKALIEDACSDIPGVTSCIVDVDAGKAVIEHDGSVQTSTIAAEIGTLGAYDVTAV